MRKAYSYIRMSTPQQLKGDSLRRQKEESERYAKKHDLQLDQSFKLDDHGVSAFTGKNVSAGALGRFVEAVRKGKISAGSVLLVESLDRISRQAVQHSMSLILELLNAGIVVVTTADGREYAPGAGLMELLPCMLLLSRGNEESAIKSYRVQNAWQDKRDEISTEKLTAKCPSWLTLSDDRATFQVNEARQDIVSRIFQESVSGIGDHTIARRLNEDRIKVFGPKKRDGQEQHWQKSSVAKILTNRAVIGEFQPHTKQGARRVPAGEPIPSYFPPIISEDLFNRAQYCRAQRRVNGAGRRGKNFSNLFTGLAKCAVCHGPMHFKNKGQGPKGGSYLVCDRASRGLGCVRGGWRYADFEASFLALVKEIDLEPVLRSRDQEAKIFSLRDELRSLLGRKEQLLADREKFAAMLHFQDLKYIADKLAELEVKLVELDKSIKAKETIIEAASRATGNAPDRNRVMDVLATLRAHDATETFALRAKAAAYLKEIVSDLELAPPPGPLCKGLVELLCLPDHPDLLAALTQRETRRYFTVKFKGDSFRTVYPNEDDPLSCDEYFSASPSGVSLKSSTIAETSIGRD